MPTPKENAIKFTGIWNLERPASVHTISRAESELIRMVLKGEGILFPPDIEGRESRLYGGTSEDFERRRTGEYANSVVEILQEVLGESYITQPCKDYFLGYMEKTSIPLGLPASLVYPLEVFGITLEAERYGIFDQNADLQGIEAGLLELCQDNNPPREWREAYDKQYHENF